MVRFGGHAAACGAMAVILVAAAQAQAASQHMEATGARLAIDSPCAKHITINPDPSLSGRVVVDISAENPQEIEQLVLESGSYSAKLRIKPRLMHEECWRPEGSWSFTSTMSITARVPPAMALAIDESGGAEYQIGAVNGALSVDLSGGVVMRAEAVQALDIDLSGGGRIEVSHVSGDIKADVSGGGDIKLGQVNAGDLNLDVSGGGDFGVAGGKIGQVKLDLSGAGRVRVGATVENADVDVSGAGDVSFGKVTGNLNKEVTGFGNVTVGH